MLGYMIDPENPEESEFRPIVGESPEPQTTTGLPEGMNEGEYSNYGPLAEAYAANNIARAFNSPSQQTRRAARGLFILMVVPFVIALVSFVIWLLTK